MLKPSCAYQIYRHIDFTVINTQVQPSVYCVTTYVPRTWLVRWNIIHRGVHAPKKLIE